MVTQTLMRNSTAKAYRQDYVREHTSEGIARANRNVVNAGGSGGAQYMSGVTGTAPRRHNLKFDEEEELISAFREFIRLDLEADEAKTRLALQPDFNLMDAY